MTDRLTISGRWLHPEQGWVEGCLVCRKGVIEETMEGCPAHTVTYQAPPGGWILPGFIDLQINGAFGRDFTEDASGSAIQAVSRRLPEHGVTAFLPTWVTMPLERYPLRLASVNLAPAHNGAIPLGLHVEGPFLNPLRRGAHEAEWLCSPLSQSLKLFLHPHLVRILTLAPELPHGMQAVAAVRRAGIVPSIGHSNADYDEARQSFARGVGFATHLFNAMPPLHHRQPGAVGALLEADAPSPGIIADGIHIHPAMLRLALTARGSDHLVLVSDAISAAGLGAGTYRLGSTEVTLGADGVRLPDGTLAGSGSLLDEAVRWMVRNNLCSLADAARMASRNPASVLGLQKSKGRLAPGCDADITVLDEELNVVFTVVGGKAAWRR